MFTYSVNGNTPVQGTYGAPVILTDLMIANGDLTIEIIDCGDATCNNTLVIQAPAPCSPECSIQLGAVDTECLENGMFRITIPVSATNGSLAWQARD
ncbi:MAG: hypothetical protein R2795_19475 [Saprospiraceae bacterium]